MFQMDHLISREQLFPETHVASLAGRKTILLWRIDPFGAIIFWKTLLWAAPKSCRLCCEREAWLASSHKWRLRETGTIGQGSRTTPRGNHESTRCVIPIQLWVADGKLHDLKDPCRLCWGLYHITELLRHTEARFCAWNSLRQAPTKV